MQDMVMEDMKMQISQGENAGHKNTGNVYAGLKNAGHDNG